jgi:hypothetical protein
MVTSFSVHRPAPIIGGVDREVTPHLQLIVWTGMSHERPYLPGCYTGLDGNSGA